MSEDDLPRDAHLRASLRHAPDASIGPPASLSEAILAEARAKARAPGVAPAPRRNPLLALWNALTQPAVGTAVAGLTVATVVGLMWWQGPGEDALPTRSPAPQSSPAPAPEAPPAPAATAAKPAEAPAAAAPPVQKEKAKKTAETAPAEGLQRRAPAPAAPPAPRPAVPVEEDRKLADPSTEGRVRAEMAAHADAARAQAAAAATARSESARAEQRVQRQFAAAAPDLAGLLTTMSAEPARWTWRFAGDNEARPADAALEEWLARADTATRGTWRSVAPPGQPPARALQLMQDGRMRHMLQLDGDRLTWIDAAGRAWQALLPPSLQEGPAR